MQELSDATKGGGKVFKQVFGEDFQTYIKNGGSLAEGLIKFGKQVGGKNLTNIFGAKEGAAAIQNLLSLPEEKIKGAVAATAAAAGTVDKQWGKIETTYQHQLNRLRESWKNMKGELGQAILPTATQVLRQGQEFLAALRPVFEKVGTALGDAFNSQGVQDFSDSVQAAWEEQIKPFLDNIFEAFQSQWPQIKEALADTADAFEAIWQVVSPLVQPLGEVVGYFLKIAVWTGANVISGAAEAVKQLADNCQELLVALGLLLAPAGLSLIAFAFKTGKVTREVKFLAFALKYHLVVGIGIARAAIVSKLMPALAALRASFIGTWLAAMAPIGLLIAAIAGIVLAFVYLWNKFETFRRFWMDAWLEIKSAAYSGLDALTDIFITIAQGFTHLFRGVMKLWSKMPSWQGGGGR